MPDASHFQEPLTPNEAEPAEAAPVRCLGRTFANDDERRAFFRARLQDHLADPAFRQTEGFPLGSDEAILDLSDPPYTTACPNPFLPDILAEWQEERRQRRVGARSPRPPGETEDGEAPYQRAPFAADVSEGKNDPIYNAHSYHTKVPHKAIMRYILHYTEPGDIVFDGFCGTGMTGVAAQLCGDRKAVESLGYHVAGDGAIYESASSAVSGQPSAVSRLGSRKAVLVDLSPAATFIAYNLTAPVTTSLFEREAHRICTEMEKQYGWMYKTLHSDGSSKGTIVYVVWSDVIACPDCAQEIVYWDHAVDMEDQRVRDPFTCPGCGGEIRIRRVHRLTEKVYDSSLDLVLDRTRQVPVMISYSFGGRRYRKKPDDRDLALLAEVNENSIGSWYPNNALPKRDRYFKDSLHLRRLTHVHQFYSRRTLIVLAAFRDAIKRSDCLYREKSLILALLTSTMPRLDQLNRFMPEHNRHVGPLVGTLYIPWLSVEISAIGYIYDKLKDFENLRSPLGGCTVSTASSTNLDSIPDQSIDYIFTDPPFGHNLMYLELNYRWESWLGVHGADEREAVVSDSQGKALIHYQRLMEHCFSEACRVLKPGRWITVEFHNTRNSIWNAIQEALLHAGFVIGDVRTLDKKKGTTNQLFYADIAKQDLVISAYRPSVDLEERFRREAGTPEGVWDFVRQHLRHLPVVVEEDGLLETVAERQDYLLFDRMVAFHIQRGASVPLSAGGFYAGLRQRFIPRDGMFFLPEQVPAYDRARLQAGRVAQLTLFVSDEKSALQWLRQQLDPALGGLPQTYQDLQPAFLRQLHQARHEALPELSLLLEQSFLQDAQGRWYAPDPNKAADLEAVRRKALLREFEGYRQGKGRLKLFRTEAVRAGFAALWQERDYAGILLVAGRLPEEVLQEDAELVMYVDNASLRVG